MIDLAYLFLGSVMSIADAQLPLILHIFRSKMLCVCSFFSGTLDMMFVESDLRS